MKLFAVPQTGLHVELLLRDEHCPPHLHVENEEVPWEARFGFSFVTDLVTLMDIDPLDEAPSARTIDRIKASIAADLARCRLAWWEKIGTCCLDNRWVNVGVPALKLLLGYERNAVQIRTARYDAADGSALTIHLHDGRTHKMAAGQGIER